MKRLFPLCIVLCLLPVCTVFASSEGSALLDRARQFFSPLPDVMTSAENPITPEKVKLGKILYYETRISVDGTVSCAKCHPFSHYAVDGLRISIGNNCKPNPRNDPTIFNAAGQMSEHWIGNRKSVEDQAKQALIGPPSFGMPSYAAVEKRLSEIKGYLPLFRAAFPGDKEPVTADNFAMAVAAFERTLVTPSPFDAFLKGNPAALPESGKKGLKAFLDTGCTACHNSTYIGGQMYRRFGIFEPYWKYTKSENIDEGRYAVTKNEADKYVFKVPILRNVEKTPPYFHDGSVDRLEDAVLIMAKVQLGKDLEKQQVEEIVSFLVSLTGEIPESALRVPVLP